MSGMTDIPRSDDEQPIESPDPDAQPINLPASPDGSDPAPS